MKKSDIVVTVIIRRSERPLIEKQVLRDLSSVLEDLSINRDKWDHDVEPIIAEGIIKHMGSVRGELSLEDLVMDIDLILKRIS